ncbi:acetolactate synthase I/II/III large subunit [Microbacterium album]|uniref:Acetolactate synthase I/II/III large subunit n=1 Tax=Microbacterium album TaxID=2053191 RepID=A0A917IGQ7_9MICO|nr:acetolactate synthase I/II/III large subunit [Microbacterium album]
MSPSRSALDVVVGTLLAHGVQTVFGLLGSGNFPLVERLVGQGVRAVAARHESAAVTMADAWSRSTRRVGVATVHQGPGFTNAVTALVEAVRSHTPLLVVTGEVATTSLHKNQAYDAATLVRDAGAGWVRIVSGATAGRDIARAWRDAVAERRPVVVSFPVDVQRQPAPDDPMLRPLAPVAASGPNADALAQAVEIVEAARKPVVIAGRGAVLDEAERDIAVLADRIGAVLATTAQAHGAFAAHPWSVGIAGGFAAPRVRAIVAESDLIISFGASLTYWTAGHGEVIADSARILQVDVDPRAFDVHRRPELAVLGGARETARQLTRAVSPGGGYRAALGELGDVRWPVREDTAPAGTVNPARLVSWLNEAVPADRNLTLDGGHFMWFLMRHFSVPDASSFVFTQNFQAIGLGLASAVGLAIAQPTRPTVVFSGDSGALMSLGEFYSIANSREPILVVMMDDAGAGAERHHFGPEGSPTDLVDFGFRDFAGIARALGIPAISVRGLEDLDVAELRHWLAKPVGAFLVDAKIDPGMRRRAGRSRPARRRMNTRAPGFSRRRDRLRCARGRGTIRRRSSRYRHRRSCQECEPIRSAPRSADPTHPARMSRPR